METPRADHFTDEARAALARAAELAQQRGATKVRPEHLLLAVLEEPWSAALRALEQMGVSVTTLQRALDLAMKPRSKKSSPPPVGTGVDQVLRVALAEARRNGAGFVGTEHILVGLLSIRDGLACAFLEEAGARLAGAKEYARTRRVDSRKAPATGIVPAVLAGASELRIGVGYDVHELQTGRRMILGGVELPCDFGPVGHSDADVLCHAIMDALLGAACLGDIGKLFPDTDPAFAGVSSIRLLEQVASKIRSQGWEPHNVDSVVVVQSPKIAPYVDRMRETLSRALGIAPERVGVKGTTTEGLGFEGEGLGIAAHAVATIRSGGAEGNFGSR